jgi:chromosome segregation ATPase
MTDINKLRQEIASLEQQLDIATSQRWDCSRKLQPLGAKKRNKPPEVLAAIQAEIDSLRAQQRTAIALQKELEPQLKKLREQLVKLERVEELNRKQAERDRVAATQNNGCGKDPRQGRDTTWRL